MAVKRALINHRHVDRVQVVKTTTCFPGPEYGHKQGIETKVLLELVTNELQVKRCDTACEYYGHK
jgi:hypothetical protein